MSLPPPLLNFPLLPVPDANGQIHFPGLEDSVRQTIQILLRTRPGEQLMRPEYGAGLENFLHELNNLTTRRRIRDAIVDALNQWESRIIVDRVEVEEVANQPTHLRVEILYRLRRTDALQHMGLTMQLEV